MYSSQYMKKFKLGKLLMGQVPTSMPLLYLQAL
jgi:hypothetical protein